MTRTSSRHLRRLLATLLTAMAFWGWSTPVQAAVRPPQLSAEGAILIDGNTGQILFGRDIRGEFYPASITKIMTAYLAITHGWHRTVVVSQAAQDQIGSSAYLVAGEHLPMPKVVTAMMLVSGNDAAYAVAQTIGGSVPAFVHMMNAQARAWGAPGIHFDNPNGLPDPKHVVSALGMAIIAEHAMRNPIFAKIVDTTTSSLPPDPKPRIYYNQNRLLYDFPGAVGIKIGYTIEADETIVGAARRHGLFLIDVLLHDTPAGLWPDAENLLSWGFAHFHPETLVRTGAEEGRVWIGGRLVPVHAEATVTDLVENGTHPALRLRVTARHPRDRRLIHRNSAVGQLQVWLGSRLVKTVPVAATRTVAPLPPTVHYQWLWLMLPALAGLTFIRRSPRRRIRGGSPEHG